MQASIFDRKQKREPLAASQAQSRFLLSNSEALLASSLPLFINKGLDNL